MPDAIQIYRRLLIYGQDQKWVAAFEPRYVLEIARLLDEAGNTQAARIEYERFLDLWKGADANLPELAEARRAVERLRRRNLSAYRNVIDKIEGFATLLNADRARRRATSRSGIAIGRSDGR